MNPDYSIFVNFETADGDFVRMSYREVVELGGWDLDYLNTITTNDGLMLALMSQFVMLEAERAVKSIEEVVDEFEEVVNRLDDDLADGLISNDETDADYFQSARDTLESYAETFANESCRYLTLKEAASIYTQAGCFYFETPTTFNRDIGDSPENVLNRVFIPHLFRFQTNLFYGLADIYLKFGGNSNSGYLRQEARDLRKEGETP